MSLLHTRTPQDPYHQQISRRGSRNTSQNLSARIATVMAIPIARVFLVPVQSLNMLVNLTILVQAHHPQRLRTIKSRKDTTKDHILLIPHITVTIRGRKVQKWRTNDAHFPYWRGRLNDKKSCRFSKSRFIVGSQTLGETNSRKRSIVYPK